MVARALHLQTRCPHRAGTPHARTHRYGFNPGSTGAMSSFDDAMYASNAAMTTTISAASAGMFNLLLVLFSTNFEKINVMEFANSTLAGLVAVTAGCDIFSQWTAILVGVGAAIVYRYANYLVLLWKVDDVVDAAAVHGAAGAWGTIAVGFFHPTEGLCTQLLVGKFAPWLLVSQTIGVLAIALLGAGPFWLMCLLLQRYGMLRVSEEEEENGIDLTVFGMNAYTVRINQSPTGIGAQRGGRRTWAYTPGCGFVCVRMPTHARQLTHTHARAGGHRFRQGGRSKAQDLRS
jgi:ammonia channel protein AmtB